MTIAAGSAALASDELNVHNADGTLKNSIVTEATLSLTDVATANVSTSVHGLTPKAPNDTEKFLRGDATWFTLIATQAEQETGTATTVAVSPGRQQYHPGAVKAWCKAGVTGNILASYNVTSVTDVGTGSIVFTWDVDFSSAHYNVNVSVGWVSLEEIVSLGTQAAGTQAANCGNGTIAVDPAYWCVSAEGDQ